MQLIGRHSQNQNTITMASTGPPKKLFSGNNQGMISNSRIVLANSWETMPICREEINQRILAKISIILISLQVLRKYLNIIKLQLVTCKSSIAIIMYSTNKELLCKSSSITLPQQITTFKLVNYNLQSTKCKLLYPW